MKTDIMNDVEIKKSVLYDELMPGHIEYLESSSDYRLFFLLEGKVFLQSKGFENRLIHGGYFSLLPPDYPVSCALLAKSRYCIIACTGLNSTGNRAFVEKLRNYSDRHISAVTTLPTLHQLEVILYSFATYMCSECQYPDVYDTLFTLLRILYTPAELWALLHPMIKEGSLS